MSARLLFGQALVLLALLLYVHLEQHAGRRALVDAVRDGCVRNGQRVVELARKTAADAVREDVLAAQPARPAVEQAHAESAGVNGETALALLESVGVVGVGSPTAALELRGEQVRVGAMIRARCDLAYPEPPAVDHPF